ncbi:hypothetical protein FRB93_006109 [Tulasnella sp. JGI-2019a]|nr:hypothetical protein FRB93_006109 [Tulasnella sp. JGI-2019a]
MPLQNSHRSHSAPHHLTSWASSTPPGVVIIPEEPSITQSASLISQQTTDFEAQDAFHAEGFFPRSESYYSLSSMNAKREQQRLHWAHGRHNDESIYTNEAEGEESRISSTRTSSPLTSSSQLITPEVPGMTGDFDPHTHLILSPTTEQQDPDAILSSQITKEDHMGGLVTSAAKVVTFPVASPSYNHEHLIHSYDRLHNTLSERRRSATAPDLVALRNPALRKTNMYDDGVERRGEMLGKKGSGPDLVTTALFSPTEEKVDYWGEEPGEEEQDGSWSAYLYESARKLLVHDAKR